jgi:sucrose synthase
MYELVQAILKSAEKTDLRRLLSELRAAQKQYFLRNEILQAFGDYCNHSQKPAHFYHSSSLGKLIHYTHEILLEAESTWFVVRTRVASQEVWRLREDLSSMELMTPQALLDVRDAIANRYQPRILEIDLSSFYDPLPTIDDPRNIGQGLEFLNRYLCKQLFTNPEHWLEELFNALRRLQYDGIPLLINVRIQSVTDLSQQLKKALSLLNKQQPHEPYQNFQFSLQELGFEPGWGNTASRVLETLELLDQFINSPNPAVLEAFVSRIPANFRIVLVSIHGWVGQEGVLGRPETAGQVAYVLDQARSLENQLWSDIKLAGLDILGIQPQVIVLTRLIPNCEETHCNLRLEKIYGTKSAWILRVPFPEFNSQVTHNWISKFEIWPYLETFAIDAERELLAQLGGSPNLIIGNYSDGGLVAFLLARRLKAIQCNIAHSLEKTKHLFSDLYWQELEEQYHFSLQFTADLISMNAANFIITSSFQEIVGTPDTVGQYESYKCFTMPQLYHVVDGIDLFSPKFNVVPPGVNENIFFPYSQTEDRVKSDKERVCELLTSSDSPDILGHLDNLSKRPIFSLAPIHAIKNLTGLAECFGKSKALQECCNLILVTGKLHPDESTNLEQKTEIQKLHDIIDQYHLHGKIRWLGMPLTSRDLGEAYRAIADCSGIFAHFASFEAFGLTILEAMISGLPTFTTQFGGSSEIIQDGENGFHINPTNLAETAEKILDFINKCDTNPQYWQEISNRAIERVHDKYNWQVHTKQLLLCARIQGFWSSVYQENREALLRYLEVLFYLIYKPRAEKLLEKQMQRS